MAEFEFVPPPEAPVFRPTVEEFANPLAFINKIRPIAEQTGIARIIPPPDWQPPFAVDVDNLKFTPRIQRLNELEAHTRVKLNFLDQIAKFWELQGSSLRIPLVEGKALDLHALHCEVHKEGGPDVVTQSRKWNKIAHRMGFPTAKHHLSFALKHHYDRILLPYDIFKRAQADNEAEGGEVEPTQPEPKTPEGMGKKMAGGTRRVARPQETTLDHEAVQELADQGGNNKELKRLQFYGAGPKMSGYQESAKNKAPRSKKILYDIDPLARYVCHMCSKGDSEESMLLCDGCDDSYHTFCLNPPLTEIPKGDWRCPQCVAAEVEKPQEAFGFEQAQKEYTLQTFGEMADQFKADYFNMPVHMIPTQTVEREFWRVVSSMDEDVCVEYGADLHTMDHGSGFPTAQSKNLTPEDQVYAESGWNLNNIAVLDDSILAHIKANISGMKVPWMYVGMCFSTFCWHNEDHWSYSINYLHWGEPKTWYGVSGQRATQLETAMAAAAPELFKAQPDLLHQLVTTMNPNVLMAAGVPVFRTDQHAGEFVITLPRAYHTGFNQGFNFAEAVNFAPPDWLSIGRECVAHYSQLRRFCVFSHDELVCSMALDPEKLSLLVATATYQNMLRMIEGERQGRTEMLEKGVRRAEREAFELLQDDERQCDYCKTTCFLSAVTCTCSKRLVCLKHYDKLCDCPAVNHILRYRYTLQELPDMLNGLKVRVESFDRWIQRVKEGLEATDGDRLGVEELKSLLQEAEAKRFPHSDLIRALSTVLEEATKCSTVAQQLTSSKVRTRTRQQQQGEVKHRLTVDELELFHEHISQLACRIPEQADISRLVQQVGQFQRRACELVEPELPPPAAEIQACVDMGAGLDIELPEIAELRQRLAHAQWMEEVEEAVSGRCQLPLDGLQKLISTGVTLPPYHVVERAMTELQATVQSGREAEERAKAALNARPAQGLPEIEALLRDAEKIPAALPNVESLQEVVKKAQSWMERVVALTDKKDHPRIEAIEGMVSRGHSVPVLLPDLSRLESALENAKAWRERAARTFLRRNVHSLLEVLSPRTDVSVPFSRKKRRPKDEHPLGAQLSAEDTTVAQIVDAYRAAETRELDLVKGMRSSNQEKRLSDQKDTKYCLCRQRPRGHMLQCQLCCDCFHATCVKGPSQKRDGGTPDGSGGNSSVPAAPPRGAHYLCPSCQRTRRPRLDTVLSLLLSLQKLALRLPEGVALQCLTERAMRWQDKARQVLSRDDMVYNLAVINAKEREASGKEPRTLGRPPNKDRHGESSAGGEAASTADSVRDAGALHIKREVGLEPPAFSSSEHAYSSAFKQSTPARKPRKAVLSPRRADSPPLPPGAAVRNLSADAVTTLETVLVEGDLLEVSLEETGQLWSLITTARPPAADMDFPDIDIVKMEGRKPGPSPGVPRKKRAMAGVDPSSRGAQPPKRLKVKVKPGEVRDSAGSGSGTVSPAPGSSATPSPSRRAPKAAANFKRKPAGKAKKMMTGKKPRAMKERAASQDSDETLSNYVEDCAATPCQKPHGSCINWIGCDDCEQWYHYICVGLPKNYQVTEDMVYICPRCQDSQSASRPGPSTSSLLDPSATTEEEEEDGASALLSLASGGRSSLSSPAQRGRHPQSSDSEDD